MKLNYRIGISVFLFSLVIFIVFIWGFYQVEESAIGGSQQPLIFSSDTDTIVEVIDDIQIEIGGNWLENYVITSGIQSSHQDSRFKIILSFSVILGTITFFLIRYLIHLHKEQWLQFAQFAKGESKVDDATLQKLYEELNRKNARHLIDYQRLQIYLSHEQKNVLSVLRADLERAHNEELLKKVDRLSQNMDDVLTLSDSIESSDKSEVDVALVTATVCDSYMGICDQISFNFDEDEELTILGKERWVYRAVSNILDNAIKYGAGNPINVNVNRKNNSIILSISDKGIGIDRESMSKIFDPHFRVNELNKDGYGIGLSLVAHVCDLCEGIVWVDSVEGKGSTFYLSFPGIS